VALTRIVGVLLSIPWLISQWNLKIAMRRIVTLLSLFVFGQVIVMIPWAIRNSQTLGHATFLTTTAGINLFIGNNPQATGSWYPWYEKIEIIDPMFSDRSVVEQNRIAGETAISWIIENPLEAAYLYLFKWGAIFRNDLFVLVTAIYGTNLSPPWPPSDVLMDYHPLVDQATTLVRFTNLFYWLLLIAELAGVFLTLALIRNESDSKLLSSWLLLILTALYFPTVSAIFLADTRFHWPTIDVLLPFAALSIVSLLQLNLKINKTNQGMS